MATFEPWQAWKRFWALPNSSPLKTLVVAALVALVCAAGVSYTAVSLRPLQEAHREQRREAQFTTMLEQLPGMGQLLQQHAVDALETRLIDLASGQPVTNVDPASFDFRAALSDPALSQPIPRELDEAGLGLRPPWGKVQLLRQDGKLILVVLPVAGRGYQSIIHALLVLRGDLNTVAALQIQEQGDTPGLGSRITEADWQGRFSGKQLHDLEGALRFSVSRDGGADAHSVDAIAGATRSSTAVGRMIRFWVGDLGYGPFLAELRREDGR